MCKYLLDLDLTLMNIWRDNYCLENDYDSKTKLSIIFSMLHLFVGFLEHHFFLTQSNKKAIQWDVYCLLL